MARILIIEDDGAQSYDMSQAVSDWGHEVQVACDGISGLQAIKDWQPDVVLSDVIMPGVSGFDVRRFLITSGPGFTDIVFLFVSSWGAGMIAEGVEIGADDYITKPIDYVSLKNKLADFLPKKQRLASTLAQQAITF